jgi:hypothetical protein
VKKVAIILFTGDRVSYIDKCIESCLKFIEKTNIKFSYDIFLISYSDNFKSKYSINHWRTDFPSENDIISMPSTKQTLNFPNDKFRINFGIYILFSQTPDTIYKNKEILYKYDYILKCRSDLVFETPNLKFNDEYLYTFECFWGGCRYNKRYTNDHFLFGKSEEVLKVISYPMIECNPSLFWNPEEYMTYLFTKSKMSKIEITTDKYYLLSEDKESRKFIGYPLIDINKNDILFFNSIGLDWKKIKFINNINE